MPKTVKGYISLMRNLEGNSPSFLKGFDSLPAEDREALRYLDAELSNNINEVKSFRS